MRAAERSTTSCSRRWPGGLGSLLARRGERVEEFVLSEPISARRHTEADRLGNAVGVLPVAVPTSRPPGALPWLLNHQRLINTFVTNLRGPETTVALIGARVREVVPVTTTVGNVPVVFGAVSYAGALILTVLADPDACPELDALAADLRAEVDALCTSAPEDTAALVNGDAGHTG
jgi:diacylglycerol O-acyltransferase